MLKRIATALWGKFESWAEVRKFLLMAITFGLIIGVYWTLRPIKDSIFDALVDGKQWLWAAKLVSLFFIVPLVVLYSKLIDTYPRNKVFYGLLGVYTLLTIGFALAFMHPTIGLANKAASGDRWLGWAWYVFVESYGSLIVALFWVIATDITLPESAKRGFPLIALFGQMGNILGPRYLNTKYLGLSNSAPIVAICSGLMFLTILMFWYFWTSTPHRLLASYHSKEEEKVAEPGFFEGLKLLFSKPYLIGIFFIVSVYEIIVTVIDYHFKQSTFGAFSTEAEKSAFLAGYAETVGWIATICLILGISNIQRVLGMRVSLICLPVLIAVAIVLIVLNPDSLMIAFWIMGLSKAINYALNQPTLKQLYIPTTKEARYKTQGWIEMFGSRGAKASASLVNGLRPAVGSVAPFLYAFGIASLGIIGVWIVLATYVSKVYNKAVDRNEVVC